MITAADKNGGGGREGDESPICSSPHGHSLLASQLEQSWEQWRGMCLKCSKVLKRIARGRRGHWLMDNSVMGTWGDSL